MPVCCMHDLITRQIKRLLVDSHMQMCLVVDALRMAEFRAKIAQKRGGRERKVHLSPQTQSSRAATNCVR